MTGLKTRWTAQATALAERLLCSGHPLSPFSPIELTEAVDLRGLAVNSVLRDTTVSGVDLSYSSFGPLASLIDVTFADVLFDHAVLGPNLSGHFQNCSFQAAKLRRITMHGAELQDCGFVGTDFSHAHGRVHASSCNFTNALFTGTHFLDGRFHHCVWQGCRFRHASLAKSHITKEGFPEEAGHTPESALLPPVILDHVHWR